MCQYKTFTFVTLFFTFDTFTFTFYNETGNICLNIESMSGLIIIISYVIKL